MGGILRKRDTFILDNEGNGTFRYAVAEPDLTYVGYSSVAWGDYDNDGRLDILLTGRDPAGNRFAKVYHNDGNGTFRDIGAGLPGVAYSSVAWGDYDNDGRLDILLTGLDASNSPVAKVYHNDGNSTFHDVGAGLTGVADSSVAWGDYDNDGRLDILLTGLDASGNPVAKVYRNDGNNTFHDIGAGLAGVADSSVAWGDYDNDGRLDILLTGRDASGSRVTKIYKNITPTANSAPAAPDGLGANVLSENAVTLSWTPPPDGQTPSGGLAYNLRVGTTPGGEQRRRSHGRRFQRLPPIVATRHGPGDDMDSRRI